MNTKPLHRRALQAAAAVAMAAVLTLVPALGASANHDSLVITTTSPLPAATAGVPYDVPIQVSTPYMPGPVNAEMWVEGGSLPAGLRVEGMRIVGTPTTAGTSTFYITAMSYDYFMSITSKQFAITVAPMVLTGAVVGQAYTASLPNAGGGDLSWSLTGGSLPEGLTLNANGTITGTPTYNSSYGASEIFTFDATAAGSTSATGSYSLKLTTPAPAITTTSLPEAWLGLSYDTAVTATGPGVTTTVTGLPAGLTYSNGVISGTTTSTGDHTVTITATNIAGSDSETLTLAVNPAPVITGADLDNAVVGADYSGSVSADGKNVTFSATGLPQGVSIDAATGAVTGVFPKTGNVSFTVTATNPSGSDSEDYSLTAYVAPVITTTKLGNTVVGETFDAAVAATGLDVTFASKDLPTTLTLDPVTGEITGTLAEGVYSFSVSATNFAGTVSKSYTVTSYGVPVITTTKLGDAVDGEAFDATVAATGLGITYSSEDLPTTLTLDPVTGKITGALAEGVHTFSITATNRVDSTSKSYTVTSYGVPVIENDSLGFAVDGEAFDATVTATGIGVTFSSEDLPTALTLDPATGKITGTLAEGVYTFSITATNRVDATTTSFTVTSYVTPVIETTTLPQAVVGAAYDEAIEFSPETATVKVTEGALPEGLTLSASGQLTGTPLAGGSVTFTVTASNAEGPSDEQAYTLVVSQPAQQLSTALVDQGGQVTVTGSGFLPGESIQIWLHSTPTLLKLVSADANGSFVTSVTIPEGTPVGGHRIESRGAASGSQWTALTVGAEAPGTAGGDTAGGETLASTGSEIAPFLDAAAALFVLGGMLLVIARRKQVARS